MAMTTASNPTIERAIEGGERDDELGICQRAS